MSSILNQNSLLRLAKAAAGQKTKGSKHNLRAIKTNKLKETKKTSLDGQGFVQCRVKEVQLQQVAVPLSHIPGR